MVKDPTPDVPRHRYRSATLHVLLVVIDRDTVSADDVIGACALPLGALVHAALDAADRAHGGGGGGEPLLRRSFDEPLLANGRVHGTLSGVLELLPPSF